MIDFDGLLYIKGSLYPNINDDAIDFLQIVCGLKASAGAVVVSSSTLKQPSLFQHEDQSKTTEQSTEESDQIKSAVFVDGRYELAAKLAVDSELFDIKSLSLKNIIEYIQKTFSIGSKIAFDPRFFSKKTMDEIKSKLSDYKLIEINLNDYFGIESLPRASEIISWEFDKDKWECIYKTIIQNHLDGYLVCDPCSSAWLMNQRNIKTKDVPVSLGYLLITKNRDNTFTRTFYFDDTYEEFPLKRMSDITSDLAQYKRIGTDFSQVATFIPSKNLVDIKDPVANIKYIKTCNEVQNIKDITVEDSEAIVNFMFWFYEHDNITELDCVQQLYANRAQSTNFISNSFDTIAAADKNSAIVHYSPTLESNKKVEKFLLLDSGGQYKFGTTDITRTFTKVEPTLQEKLYYTLVLKGHIAVAMSTANKESTTQALDAKARMFLQQHSLDFNHSTGHGIGYMLSVHEGPVAISKNNKQPLCPNILLSNEPGVYIENHLGIRLENMMVTRYSKGAICFDTISFVPFDNKFIDFSLITLRELEWLKNYNRSIMQKLNISEPVRNWLSNYMQISW